MWYTKHNLHFELKFLAIEKFCMGKIAHFASIQNRCYPWKQNTVLIEVSTLVGHGAASLGNLILMFLRRYSDFTFKGQNV
jgi:hypothetical protein